MEKRAWLLVTALGCLALPAGARGAGGRPVVTLNHFYSIISDDAWQALAASPFLREEFAESPVIPTSSEQGEWTGFYFFGKRNFVELFPRSNPPHAESAKGIATEISFGVDHSGELDALEAYVRQTRPETELERAFLSGPGEPPWVFYLGFKPPFAMDSSFAVMEWNTEYYNSKPSTCPSPAHDCGDMTRERFNAHFYKPDRLLQGVRGLTLAMDGPTRQHFTRVAELLGFVATPGEGAVTFKDPEVEYRVVDAAAYGGANGVLRIDFALNRAAGAVTTRTRFGADGELVLAGDRAEASLCFRLDPGQPCRE
jgi:hypothetical protein